MSMGSDGIIHSQWAKGTAVDRNLAWNSVEAVTRISEGGRVALLIDISGLKSMTHEAREIYADAKGLEAVALLAGSPVATIIGNFYMGMKRASRVPTRMFSSEDKAISWLKERLK